MEKKIEDCYLTVGELKKILINLPDDAKVYYQRIEDRYFKKHGWTTLKKPSPDYPNEFDEWIGAWGHIEYLDDGNCYITAHY